MQNSFGLKLNKHSPGISAMRKHFGRLARSLNLLTRSGAALGCALALSSCFKMGLVENYAPLISAHPSGVRAHTSNREPSGHRSLVLVLKPSLGEAEEIIGHQYVLGFIPATRLYVQQGVKDYVYETVLEQLQLEGHDVLTADESTAARAASIFEPNHIIKAEIGSISTTAYDGLLMRIASASASIDYTSFSVNKRGELEASGDVTFERTRRLTKRSARAPILSALLEDTIADTLSDFAKSPEISIQSRREHYKQADSAPLPVVRPPSFGSEVNTDTLLSRMGSSYGFASVPPFSAEAALRIIQRGIEKSAASELETGAATVLQPTIAFANNSVHWWNIDAHIVGVKFLEQARPRLQIDAMISVSEQSTATSSEQLLWHASCSVSAPRRDEVDGYWVHTLEDASRMLFTSAMHYFQGASTHCRPPGDNL